MKSNRYNLTLNKVNEMTFFFPFMIFFQCMFAFDFSISVNLILKVEWTLYFTLKLIILRKHEVKLTVMICVTEVVFIQATWIPKCLEGQFTDV